MLTANNWKDYELYDCGYGQRLERWGNVWLVRPDPQAIWTPFDPQNIHWKNPDGKYNRSKAGGGEWQRSSGMPEKWTIGYDGMTFTVRPMNFKHTGIFPEQAVNWDIIGRISDNAKHQIRILNLFGYTGCASLSAAKHGASVCHVDAAKGMIALGKENVHLSALDDRPIRWIVDDCMKFIEREQRRGNRYDGIIMDPPSYGRGPSGEIWHIEDALESLIVESCKLLSDSPAFMLVNSYSAGLSACTAGCLLKRYAESRYGGRTECNEIGIPVTSGNIALPAGSSALWLSDNVKGL